MFKNINKKKIIITFFVLVLIGICTSFYLFKNNKIAMIGTYLVVCIIKYGILYLANSNYMYLILFLNLSH